MTGSLQIQNEKYYMVINQYENGKRKEKLSGNTLVHYHACIRKALDTAYKRDLVLENIADKVERPKKDKYHASFYDKNELYDLFEKSKDDPLALVIYVTAFYGLRRSDG